MGKKPATPASSAGNQQLLTATPWVNLRISRSRWYQLTDRPLPIKFPGQRRRWRVSDLQAYLQKLPTDPKSGKTPPRKRKNTSSAESSAS